MISGVKEITINKELKEYILPLSDEEFAQLEKNILSEGCREPLIVWEKKDDEMVLVDGNNRYKICRKHGIPFKIKKVHFRDMEEVKIWMVDNQMGRRNLTPDQLSYYRGLKYLSLKKKKGGFVNVKAKGQSEVQTADLISDQFNVSKSTVKRDAKFAEGLNIIGRSNPILKVNILTGKSSVKKADVQILADSKNSDKISFKNEADLYNKAKKIRDEILSEVEESIKRIDKERVVKAEEYFKEKEPVFQDKDDRLKRIKGLIISAINKAINNKDEDAIKELKKLIDRLANELFD